MAMASGTRFSCISPLASSKRAFLFSSFSMPGFVRRKAGSSGKAVLFLRPDSLLSEKNPFHAGNRGS